MGRSTWAWADRTLGRAHSRSRRRWPRAHWVFHTSRVRVAAPVDTRYSPYEWQTVASRLTWSMGNAVVQAARDVRRQVLDVAAEAWGERPADLDIVNGVVISYKSEKEAPLKNLGIYGLPKPDGKGWRGGPDHRARQLHALRCDRSGPRNGAG